MPAPPLLLGHRGARGTAQVPENTIVSFDLALEHGCDGVEFDVRMTKCGSAVICHNAKSGRVAVAQVTCRQLKHLPRLEDVLQHFGNRTFLDIDLKVRGLETTVLAALREAGSNCTCVVSSSMPAVVMELKARSADVAVGIICGSARQLVGWRKLPVEYVVVRHTLLTRTLVQRIHSAGRKVLAWTVNDKPSMLRLAGWGVDGIISDNTRLLGHTFA